MKRKEEASAMKFINLRFESIKEDLAEFIAKIAGIKKSDILPLLANPPSVDMGDIAFACFALAKTQKRPPDVIAAELAKKLKESLGGLSIIEKTEAVGGYINFYFNRKTFAEHFFQEVFGKGENYGHNNSGKGKKIVIEMSSPNIAKPFGIGHLRSTLIGESLSRIYKANGYDAVKINYLGDWGTQFGKLIYGIKKWGDESKLVAGSINYLQELYIKANLEQSEESEAEARKFFKRLEEGDKATFKLWGKLREISLTEFNNIYSLLGIAFDEITGESNYVAKSKQIIEELLARGIAIENEGSVVVDLKSEGKGVAILKKSDGTTIYLSRDIAAAIDRYERYRFDEMIYEVGAEQKLHFHQLFAILSKMGFAWSATLKHVSHGLYLGMDGKKLSTRQGTSVRMKDIWDYTFNKVKNELKERKKGELNEEDLDKAKKITRAAIFYADLSNYRENDIKYNLDAITLMEGDTGPYLLYSYARCKSILRKLNYCRAEKHYRTKPTDKEYLLIRKLAEFPEAVSKARIKDDPSIIARFALEIAKEFNSFYTQCKVKGSSREKYRAQIIDAYSSVLKNALLLIGIEAIETM